MFIWEIFAGPIHFILLLLVLAMFFHVIIPLSAFGRLIIHTGAMGRRPVLDVELEKELLPSGLHNSLLIRATDRRRKYKSSATDQYRRKHGSRSHRILGSSIPSGYGTSNASQRLPRDIVVSERRPEDDDLTLEGVDDVAHEDDDGLEGLEIHSDYASDMMMDPEIAMMRGQSGSESSGNIGHHRRLQTMDTVRCCHLSVAEHCDSTPPFLTSIVSRLGRFRKLFLSSSVSFECNDSDHGYSKHC